MEFDDHKPLVSARGREGGEKTQPLIYEELLLKSQGVTDRKTRM